MKHFFRNLTLSVFAALLVAATATLALARVETLPAPARQAVPALFGLFEKKKEVVEKKQDIYEIHDDASFYAHSKPFNMMPYAQLNLQFEVYLPSDWTPEDLAMNGKTGLEETITGQVARFTSPMIGTQIATASVDVLHVEHETSARNWLKNYVTSAGYLRSGEAIEFTNKSATAYYTYSPLDNSGTRFVYIAARMSGPYVETFRFEVPLQLKTYLAFLQRKSVDSFRLLNPREGWIEDPKTFTMVDSIKLNYPASWELQTPDFRDMNKLLVTMQAFKPGTSVVEGYLKIIAVRRSRLTNLATEIDNMRKFFKDTMKIEFKKMIASGKSDAYERFLFNRYEIYDVISTKAKVPTTQEVHLVVLGDKEWYIFAFIFTPKEVSALPSWARNVQSFQEMMKSVK